MDTSISQLLKASPVGEFLTVNGWVRTRRDSGSITFIEISDGTGPDNLQVIVEDALENFQTEIKRLSTGCAVAISGILAESPAKGQRVELKAEEVKVIGWADPETYPLQKKRHSFEFLRSIPHLRGRTNALGAVTRIRSILSHAIHDFFKAQGFFQIHTPVITTSDCEGAGEMFTVTSLEPQDYASAKGFEKDFFGKHAGLTVSGQLQAEIYALSHSRVYTFGPTFRAENSNTSRHLAEFWMLEPEIAFCDLNCAMGLAEQMIKHLIGVVLAACPDDLAIFNKFVAKGLLDRLEMVHESEFLHMTYTDAVDELINSKKTFEFPVKWGIDLQAEHERFLCEEVAGVPVIVTNYPKEIKPFYMRLDDNNATVAAMDILVPGIGELVGGSQREERYEVLCKRMEEAGLDSEEYGWYLDLRKYGSVPHSGFGLGFERLMLFITGMQNIRDVISFPRTPGNAPC